MYILPPPPFPTLYYAVILQCLPHWIRALCAMISKKSCMETFLHLMKTTNLLNFEVK